MASGVVSPPRCEICGADITPLHESLDVGRCASCGLVTLLAQPSAEELLTLYSSTSEYEQYVAAARSDALHRRYAVALDRLSSLLAGRPGQQVLFDVGAGAGAFLERALARGYEVTGNEVSEPAMELCSQRLGVRLSDQVLGEQPGQDRFDALTMWCVLAHVPDPREALTAALRLLKPGGVLYFHTPRWCAIDSAGLGLSRLSRGRLSQITRRRIGPAHMRLYSRSNLARLVTSVGFDIVDLRSKAAYSLQTEAYLRSLNVPRAACRPVARGVDLFIDRDLVPRNVLDVYLRKPSVRHHSSRRS